MELNSEQAKTDEILSDAHPGDEILSDEALSEVSGGYNKSDGIRIRGIRANHPCPHCGNDLWNFSMRDSREPGTFRYRCRVCQLGDIKTIYDAGVRLAGEEIEITVSPLAIYGVF